MQTLRQRAYLELRSRLQDGRLRAGDRLGEVKLAESLQISRGPLREAINQLASDGLVDHAPGVGAFVRNPDATEIEEIYGVRLALESHAAEVACGKIGAVALARLSECCDAMQALTDEATRRKTWSDEDRQNMMRLDTSFHNEIARATENRPIMKLLSDYQVLQWIVSNRVEPHSRTQRRDSAKLAIEEHRQILDALRRADAVAARKAMSRHFSAAEDRAQHRIAATDQVVV